MVPELVEVVAAVVAVVVGGVYCGARKVRTAIWGLRKKSEKDNHLSGRILDFHGTREIKRKKSEKDNHLSGRILDFHGTREIKTKNSGKVRKRQPPFWPDLEPSTMGRR